MRKVDTDRIIREISDTLTLWEGTDIAEKASDILGHEVKYLGDGYFQIEEEEIKEFHPFYPTNS